MKVAIVHDWLVNYGGAERVVEIFLELFPQADLYTLVYDEKKMSKIFPKEIVRTSYIQKIPFGKKIYTKLLSFMPKAFEEFDFSEYDLVICSSSCCAKGIITPIKTKHIAYIHSPMRYAWDLYYDYKRNSNFITKFFMKMWIPNLRLWDFVSSQRIDTIIANSNYISKRIKKFWNRDSIVIHPPVDLSRLCEIDNEIEDYYCAFSRFVSYKRLDLAIKACIQLNKKLVVIGDGSEGKKLRNLAKNHSNIIFTGRISDEKVKRYLQKCKALIFCAEEDFGIIPLEAQACGRPVIAFGKGGALETVIENKTGIFFDKQETQSLCNAIEKFENMYSMDLFNPLEILNHAKTFSVERFKKEIMDVINENCN